MLQGPPAREPGKGPVKSRIRVGLKISPDRLFIGRENAIDVFRIDLGCHLVPLLLIKYHFKLFRAGVCPCMMHSRFQFQTQPGTKGHRC